MRGEPAREREKARGPRERKEDLGRKRPKERREDFNCFLFILNDWMNFVLLKLLLELRKFTEKFGEYIRAQRILQNISGQ